MRNGADTDQGGRYSYGSPTYRWYSLAIISLVAVCLSIDRAMPNILIEPVRHEFGLNDRQLGLFVGLSYAVTFSLAVLPLGYISDRVNRRNLLAGLVVAWSVCTALGGFARDYIQLLLSRMGVGAAEAGGTPISVPMISDMFPPERRALAVGVYYSSAASGVLLSSVIGGFLAAEYGWRVAFFVAGLPGLFMAVILFFTVREPRRGMMELEPAAEAAEKPKFSEAFTFLSRSPGVIMLILALCLLGLVTVTTSAWMGSFFIRVHDMSLPHTGLVLGLAAAGCGVTAPPLLGWLADRISVNNSGAPLNLTGWAALLAMLAGFVMLFSSGLSVAIGAFFVHELAKGGYTGPCYAALMDKTPPRLRGTVMSVTQLMIVVCAYGLGPITVGALSDAFGGGAAIRGALALAIMVMAPAAVLLFMASAMIYGRRASTSSGQ